MSYFFFLFATPKPKPADVGDNAHEQENRTFCPNQNPRIVRTDSELVM